MTPSPACSRGWLGGGVRGRGARHRQDAPGPRGGRRRRPARRHGAARPVRRGRRRALRPVRRGARPPGGTRAGGAAGPPRRRGGGEVARIVPRLAARVPDVPPAQASDPETERFLLFRAVTALLGAAARRTIP